LGGRGATAENRGWEFGKTARGRAAAQRSAPSRASSAVFSDPGFVRGAQLAEHGVDLAVDRGPRRAYVLTSVPERMAHSEAMALSTDDRMTIYELIALHGHLVDAGDFHRLDELFTDDFVYDVGALGFGSLEGADAFVAASRALGDGNPLGHHVTNVLVVADEGDVATVRSKGIGILADGTSGTVVYEDLVRRTGVGWRIFRRTVIPRHRPLHP
jgi:ketosteroid isomerase-like protein